MSCVKNGTDLVRPTY